MLKEIFIKDLAGTFAENKDIARSIRVDKIIPALVKEQEVILDFSGVTGATQSFVHALISEAIRRYGDKAFDLLLFKECSAQVKEVVTLVSEYMQES